MRVIQSTFILLIILTTGCTTMKTSPETSWRKIDKETAKVIVLRGSGWMSGKVEAGFGSQSNYVVALSPMEYAVLSIPVGDHNFRVGSPQSVSSNISVSLSQTETTCIMVKANAVPMLLAFTIPILVWASPTFTGKEIDCPGAGELESYNLVTANEGESQLEG
jgi:hypothetical protein